MLYREYRVYIDVVERCAHEKPEYEGYEKTWREKEWVGNYAVDVRKTDLETAGLIKNAAGEDVTKNYNFGDEDVITLEDRFVINQRPVTITIGNIPNVTASSVSTQAKLDKILANNAKNYTVTNGSLAPMFADDPGHVKGDEITSINITATLDGTPKAGDKIILSASDSEVKIERNPVVSECYAITVVPGELTVVADPVTPTPTPPTPPYIPPYTPTTPTTPTPAPEVLGARRTVTVDPVNEGAMVLGARRDTGEAVLGARKGQTGDTPLTMNYLILMLAFAGLMLLNADRVVVAMSDKRRRARREARK